VQHYVHMMIDNPRDHTERPADDDWRTRILWMLFKSVWRSSINAFRSVVNVIVCRE